MVSLTEKNYGTDKNIPQMILAGASLDDVYVIVMFTSFLGMETGGSFSFISLLSVPISVFSGIPIGVACGAVLAALFSKIHIRDSIKVTILMAMAFLFTGAEEFITSKIIPFSGLIAVISMAVIIKNKKETVADRLSEKFSRLWLPAEILLFVLLGASVDVSYAAKSGIKVLILIFLALFIRSVGVFICTFKSDFSAKECLFCALAYLPKATVQAAIGSVPLSMGLPCGQIVLSVAVTAILITAPLGAAAIDFSYKKLLTENPAHDNCLSG